MVLNRNKNNEEKIQKRQKNSNIKNRARGESRKIPRINKKK